MYALIREGDPTDQAPRLFTDLTQALDALRSEQDRFAAQLLTNGEGTDGTKLRHEIRPYDQGTLGDPVVRSVTSPQAP